MKRHAALVLAVVSLAACVREKPAPDTTAAVSPATAMPAPDTMKATPPPVPDSVKLMKQADTKGTATKGVPATAPPRVAAPTKTPNQPPIIGRDSVRQGPIIGIPSIVDTAKKRPPL